MYWSDNVVFQVAEAENDQDDTVEMISVIGGDFGSTTQRDLYGGQRKVSYIYFHCDWRMTLDGLTFHPIAKVSECVGFNVPLYK